MTRLIVVGIVLCLAASLAGWSAGFDAGIQHAHPLPNVGPESIIVTRTRTQWRNTCGPQPEPPDTSYRK